MKDGKWMDTEPLQFSALKYTNDHCNSLLKIYQSTLHCTASSLWATKIQNRPVYITIKIVINKIPELLKGVLYYIKKQANTKNLMATHRMKAIVTRQLRKKAHRS
jgi:hypothetical protein